MDADDETARMPTRPASETRPFTTQFVKEDLEFPEAEEANSELYSSADIAAKRRAIQAYIIKKGARRKKRFFESSAQEQMPREEEVPTMAEMDSGIHGEELSDWMSQLFEKLDLEVNEDNICSTGNVTEVEAHPIAKEVISPKIQMPTKLKDSSMAHTDINGFEWMSVVDDSDFGNEDAFLDWIVDMLKKGGRDDLLSQFDLDQADVSYDVQDELSDLDEDVEDSHTSVKRASNKETLENGIKWMSEECFLAFLESAERKRFEGIEHRFGELRSQCLNIEAYDKIFHHYNFTIEAKHGSSDI